MYCLIIYTVTAYHNFVYYKLTSNNDRMPYIFCTLCSKFESVYKKITVIYK